MLMMSPLTFCWMWVYYNDEGAIFLVMEISVYLQNILFWVGWEPSRKTQQRSLSKWTLEAFTYFFERKLGDKEFMS